VRTVWRRAPARQRPQKRQKPAERKAKPVPATPSAASLAELAARFAQR